MARHTRQIVFTHTTQEKREDRNGLTSWFFFSASEPHRREISVNYLAARKTPSDHPPGTSLSRFGKGGQSRASVCERATATPGNCEISRYWFPCVLHSATLRRRDRPRDLGPSLCLAQSNAECGAIRHVYAQHTHTHTYTHPIDAAILRRTPCRSALGCTYNPSSFSS